MPRSPDFFRNLTEQRLEELEEFARQPGRTVDEAREWLVGHGVQTSRSAVGRWLQDFRLEDANHRASEVAKNYLAAARESDPTAVTEASIRKFEEMVFDFLANGEGVGAGDLMKIAVAMKTGIGSRREIDELKKKQRDAIAAAEKAAQSGQSGVDVVSVIKKSLGLAA